jgi:hypothetical protein
MFLFRRRNRNLRNKKHDISKLVGKPRSIAIQSLRGLTVQYVALKAGEAFPPVPAPPVYMVCYDSITDIVTFAA